MKAHGLAALLVLCLGTFGCGGSSGHFVYVVGQGTNSVFGFSERASGTLSPLSSTFATDSIPDSMVIHPSGKLAFVANFGSGSVSIFLRSGNGTLATSKDPVTGNVIGPILVGTNPIALAMSSNGQFLYVLNQGGNNISVFSVDGTTGNLTPLKTTSTFATPAAPRSMTLAANGKFLYIANPTLSSISGFTVGSDGTLSAIAGSPFTAGTAPSWVALDPQSKFLYVADPPSNDILGFAINSGTGAPTAISGSPFAAGTHPVSLAIDSQSALLVAANQGSNNLSAYSINSSGVLSPLGGSPFTTGQGPVFVTVDSSNNFVFVGDGTSNDIVAFSIVNGKLNNVIGSPFNIATSPTWITTQ